MPTLCFPPLEEVDQSGFPCEGSFSLIAKIQEMKEWKQNPGAQNQLIWEVWNNILQLAIYRNC